MSEPNIGIGIAILSFMLAFVYIFVSLEIRASERRIIEEIKKREATNDK